MFLIKKIILPTITRIFLLHCKIYIFFESSFLEERCNKSLLTFYYKIIVLNYSQTKFL